VSSKPNATGTKKIPGGRGRGGDKKAIKGEGEDVKNPSGPSATILSKKPYVNENKFWFGRKKLWKGLGGGEPLRRGGRGYKVRSGTSGWSKGDILGGGKEITLRRNVMG